MVRVGQGEDVVEEKPDGSKLRLGHVRDPLTRKQDPDKKDNYSKTFPFNGESLL